MAGSGSLLRALQVPALLGGCAAPRGYVATWVTGYAPRASRSPAREAEELLRGNEGGLWAVRWDEETDAPALAAPRRPGVGFARDERARPSDAAGSPARLHRLAASR